MDCLAWRRRIPKVRAVEERTGDIAHLEARPSISLFVRHVKRYSLFVRWYLPTKSRRFPPAHTVRLSRLCACVPQGILFPREERRATVPASTVGFWCVRGRILGLLVHDPWPNTATFSASAATAFEAAAGAATRPGALSLLSREEARRWAARSSIHPLPHLAAGPRTHSGRRQDLERTHWP